MVREVITNKKNRTTVLVDETYILIFMKGVLAMITVERDLGGYFKWFEVDRETTIVDPRYLKEYRESLKRKRSRLMFVVKSFRVVARVLRIKHLYNSMAASWR